jgi:hypothetical protein
MQPPIGSATSPKACFAIRLPELRLKRGSEMKAIVCHSRYWIVGFTLAMAICPIIWYSTLTEPQRETLGWQIWTLKMKVLTWLQGY